MLRSRTLLSTAWVLLVFGCGSEQYEARLAETNAFFEDRQRLDRVLQNGNWGYPQFSLSMRIPKGFELQAGPPPAKEGELVPEDTRQPNYLGLRLPGLLGAWHAKFNCDGVSHPAFLYVCSNHQGYLDLAVNPNGPDPALFLAELEAALASTLQVNLPANEGTQVGNNVRYAETRPQDSKYAAPKKFTGITFVPNGVLPQMGVEIKAQMYEHYNGPIQIAVLAIYPAAICGRPEDQLLTALETLNVTNQIPQVQTGKSGAAGSPGTKGF